MNDCVPGNFVSSVTGVSCKFLHTVVQSVLGHRRVTRISAGSGVALSRVCNVLYVRLLYAFSASVGSCGAMYAESCA